MLNTITKITKMTIVALAASLFALSFGSTAHAAASDVSVKVEKPKSPTRINNFNLNFVALDIQGRGITAKCYKKSPSDGAFTQFGADIALSSGGNTANCAVTSSILGANGTYQFYVTATAGEDTATSETVSVTYDTNGPGDPRDYSKTRTNSCEYTIHFKTADDAGMTVKVEVYRSENTSFSADDGSRVLTVNAGSNETHDATNTVPDCNKNYYYAIRSFDAAGNGSGIVGDSEVTITNATTTTTPPSQQTAGAIPVNQGGSVLGQTASTGAMGATGTSGDTLGETSPSAEVVDMGKTDDAKKAMARNLMLGGGILLLGAILYANWKKKQTQAQ